LEVLSSRIERFKAAFHSSEGLWSEASRSLPGDIVTRMIQHDENATKLLALSFQTSCEAFRNAYASSAISEFNHWLDCLTVTWADIGLMSILSGEEALAAIYTVSHTSMCILRRRSKQFLIGRGNLRSRVPKTRKEALELCLHVNSSYLGHCIKEPYSARSYINAFLERRI
jgi:hypothetical protein